MLTILGVCSPLQLEKVSARKRRRTRMRELPIHRDQQVSRLTFTFLRKHKATVPVASWTLRDCNWDWTGLSAVVNLVAFNSSQ